MMKRTLLSALIVSFLITGNAQAMSPAAYQYYLTANYYLSLKQNDKAIRDFEKAIELAPRDSMLYLKLAGIYNDIGNWKKAVEIYYQATKIKPDDSFIYVSIGNILQQNQDYQGALNAYMKSYEIFPSYKYNLYNIANSYFMLNKLDEAMSYYKEFLATYPDHLDARKNLISIYRDKEDYKNVVENYRYIFKKNPKKFKDFYLFSYALMKSGDYKNAVEGFKNEINLNTNNANAYAHLGFSYLNLTPENKKSALTCFERAFVLGGDFENYRALYAGLLADEGKYEDALVQYEKYLAHYPKDDNAYLNTAVIYVKNKKYNLAITNLNRAIEINSKNIMAKAELAYVYQMLKDYRSANAIYDEIVKPDTQDANLLYNAALSYQNVNNFEKAISCYEKSLSIKQNQEVKYELANCYVNYAAQFVDKKNYEQAVVFYDKATTLNPDNQVAYTGLAFCHQSLGNSQKSSELYERAVSISSKTDEDFIAYGKSLYELKKYDEAKGALEKAIELNPNIAAAHEILGDVYMQLQMPENAKKEYEASLKIDNSLVNANVKLGNLYKENLDNNRALMYYNNALLSDEHNPAALYNKAVTLFDMDKLAEAKDVYIKLTNNNPNFAMAYYGMGVIAEKEKNYADAITQYKQFIAKTDNESLKKTLQRRIELLKTRI